MAKQFFTDINLNGNIIKNVALESLVDIPDDPNHNRIYYNSGTETVNIWTGTKWIELGAGAGGTVDINRSITRDFDDLTGLNLYSEYGGSEEINLTEFIENVFYPLIKATLSLSVADGNYIEMAIPDVTLTEKVFNGSVTVNGWNNSSGQQEYYDFYINGVPQSILTALATTDFNQGQSVDILHTYGTTTIQSSIKVEVDSVIHTLTSSASFSIRLPDFWGVTSDNSLELTSLYSGLTKVLNGEWTTKTLTFTTSDGDYLMFAIPAIWEKKVTSIVDNAGQGDDVTSAFITDLDDGVVLADITRSVQRMGNWTYDYYVYVTRHPLSEDEQELKINLGSV